MRPSSTTTTLLGFAACAVASTFAAGSCSTGDPAKPAALHTEAGAPAGPPPPPPPDGSFCALPGSVVAGDNSRMVIPGGPQTPDMSWVHVPAGFCAHYFTNVGHVRQLKFAPDGQLFAASPSTLATGGSVSTGIGAVVIVPDDNHDGVAETAVPFVASVPTVQGLAFDASHLYYQDDKVIRRAPLAPGARAPSGPSEVVTRLDETIAQQAAEHWPKMIDFARDGTLYVTNGSGQGELCVSTHTPYGAVFKVGDGGVPSPVSMGFRNPIALRCEPDHDVCLAAELALDGSGDIGREKIVPVRPGDDWGFPCCATLNLPYLGAVYMDTAKAPDCSHVAPESASFVVGHTPFGIDFEMGKWPAPWAHRAFVTLHGVVGSWVGARVVAIELDPITGLPLPASDAERDGGDDPSATHMLDFATGWDTGRLDHGRPAPIAFAPDGRLFVGNDWNGDVIWMAPADLMRP